MAAATVPTFFDGDAFSIIHAGNRLEVLSGDITRWTVDAEDFGPQARVRLKRTENGFLIELLRAFFPGTAYPADFQCVLARSLGAWSMHLRAAGSQEFSADWVKWLERREPAVARWSGGRVRPVAGLAILHSGGTVSFTPDWIFTCGKCRVELNGIEDVLDCESWRWQLSPQQRIGPVDQDAVATAFYFARGGARWRVPLSRTHSDGWSLDHDEDDLFDELTVEASRRAGNEVHTALLSASGTNSAVLRFFPGGGLYTAMDEPFHLRVEQPRLAFSLSEPKVQSVLVADFAAEESWAHTEAMSIAFGGGGTQKPLEIHCDDNKATANAAPPVKAVQIPAPDTSIRLDFEPNKHPPVFRWSHFVQPIERVLGALHLLPWEHHLAFDLTHGDVLTVVRPADMLRLQFKFEDMELHTFGRDKIRWDANATDAPSTTNSFVGDNGTESPEQPGFPVPCARGKSTGKPAVTVIFAPQHIGEQAFFHNDDGKFSRAIKNSVLGTAEVNRLHDRGNRGDANALADPDSAPATPSSINKDSLPLQAKFAGESTLVFDLESKKPIPFTVESLLRWQSWSLRVTDVAKTQATPLAKDQSFDPSKPLVGPEIVNPGTSCTTAIELPYQLILSPSERGQWAHSPTAVSRGTANTELWHTRLAVAGKTGPDENNVTDRTVRAVYTPGFDRTKDLLPHQSGDPRFALDDRDRSELVYLTSDYRNNLDPTHKDGYRPLPINLDHLMLTPLGGYLKGLGKWEPPMLDPKRILTLEQWKHIATVGRDQYVRVVYKGYLAPFSHRASLVKVTERFIVTDVVNAPVGKYFALLHQRMYIVVHEPRRDFPLMGQPFAGRDFPFRRIDVLTTVTPDLDDPTKQVVQWLVQRPGPPRLIPRPFLPPLPVPGPPITQNVAPPQSQSLFWPCVNGNPFAFRFRFWDMEGNVSEASLPVLFGDAQQSQTHGGVGPMVQLYNGGRNGAAGSILTDPLLATPFGDQSIAFAPSSQTGDTRYDADTIVWQVDDQSTGDAAHDDSYYSHNLPLFSPRLDHVKASSAAVKRISNPNSGAAIFSSTTNAPSRNSPPAPDSAAKWMKYFEPFKSWGFDQAKNRGEVFLEVDDPAGAPTLQFGANSRTDQAGGFSSPDTKIVGFSRKAGPVGGTDGGSLTSWSSGKFDPPDFFGGLTSATILGAVKLSDLIMPLLGGMDSNLEKAPQMLQQSLFDIEQSVLDFEKAAVDGIRKFQEFAPTSAQGNPLARRIAPQAQIVYSSLAAVEKVQGKSPDLGAEVDALPLHAKLVRSIVDYAQALDTAINDPASLAAGLTDDLMAAVGVELDALEQALLAVVEPAAQSLVNQLSNTLADAIQSFLQPISQLASATIVEPLPLLDETLRPTVVAIHDLMPEVMALVSMLPIAQRLQGNVEQLDATLQPKGRAVQWTDVPALLQQTGAILQDLLNLVQAGGPLGIAGNLSPAEWSNLQKGLTDLLNTLTKTIWDNVDTIGKMATQVIAIEQKCMALADVVVANDRALLMQNLRQFQRSLDMITACGKVRPPENGGAKPKLRFLQRLQQLQRQAIDSLRMLHQLANAALLETAAIKAAARDFLVALCFDGQVMMAEATCIQNLIDHVMSDAKVLLGGASGTVYTTFLPALSAQLDSISKQLTTAINDSNNALQPVGAAGKNRSAAQAAYRQALQKSPPDAHDIQTKKAAFDQADQAVDPLLAGLPSLVAEISNAYDLALKYINGALLVLSWWTYASESVLAKISSRDKLKGLALNFASSVCTDATPLCANAQKLVSKLIAAAQDFSQNKLGAAPAPIPALFAGVTDPINGLRAPASNNPADILVATQAAVTAFTQCAAEVRQRINNLVQQIESLAQARNLLPILLTNLPIPHTLSFTYDWSPQIKSFEPVFLLDSGAKFTIKASSQVDVTGSKPPSYSITATLTSFSINLIGSPSFVIVRAESLTFTSSDGQKPDCRLKIRKVDFGQDLAFVQKLAEALNPKNGPFVEFTGLGIRAGFRFHVPDLTMGAFLMMQLAIDVAVALSFDGSPVRCQFGLSSQQNPFLLSAGIYGGGGFLQLELGLDGVQTLEGALEFGLVAGITIGPISGSGYVVAGVYMKIVKSDSSVAGFVHAHGHMDIFGIISMDVDLMVMVKYQGGSVTGSAVFTVSVHILFFSASFTLEASYGFQGSGSNAADSGSHSAQLQSGTQPEHAKVEGAECGVHHWMSDREWTEFYEAFA